MQAQIGFLTADALPYLLVWRAGSHDPRPCSSSNMQDSVEEQ